jgi:hypothetical protein
MIVVGKDKVGNESKCLKLEYMETILNIFIDYLFINYEYSKFRSKVGERTSLLHIG